MMDFSEKKLNDVLSRIEADDVKFVRFEFSDIYGVARSKIIPLKHFADKATNGVECSMSYLGWDPTGEDINLSEMAVLRDSLMFPDLDTYTTIPWCENTGRILMEPTLKGKVVSAHPRTLARRQLDALKDLGYTLLSAFEHEFIVVDKEKMEPYIKGHSCRSTIRNYKDPALNRQLLLDLPKVGVDIEFLESEWEEGQLEIANKPSFGIQAADVSHTFRISVKEIAIQHGYIATFMTKPWPETVSRTAIHFNHSLWDINGGTNVTSDPNSANVLRLSKVARHWIAGVLAHTPALAILMAPTANCLRSFEPNVLVPTNATWGFYNRTTALRVKEAASGGMYIESRLSSGTANPYIVLAAIVAAGIDGIRNQMAPPPDVKGDASEAKNIPEDTAQLPVDMKTALQCFRDDQVIRKAMGDEFWRYFEAHKLKEIRLEEEAKAKGDTEWERNLFLEYI